MGELKTTEGFYIGKEFGSTGTTKAGKEYTRYKAKFRPRLDTDKAFSFTVFTPMTAKETMQLEELKDGIKYKILFSEEEYINKQGIKVNGKTAVGFYEATDQTAPVQNQQGTAGIDLSKFEEFTKVYMQKVKENNVTPNAVHMVGSYIVTYDNVRVTELIKKCKAAIEQPTVETVQV